jgi:formylglycine-generating enzyme required for sulfatase activity
MEITAIPAGARISVDGSDVGVAPSVVDAPSGVRHLRIAAPNLQTWESSVVLRAGEALNIGPITLGQPDAHLSIKSEPTGAEVAVSGSLRGRTPLEIDLPAGIEHEVLVNSAGFAPWSKKVFGEPGKVVALTVRLSVVSARIAVQGEPSDAQVMIDGVSRGQAPGSFELPATEHRIEVHKEGWQTFTTTLTPAPGFDRSLHYRLRPADRSLALAETAATLYSQIGYTLRLVPGGTFLMGSDRREQGRRPNEGLRQVTLKRPFYLGITEVTNEQFRRFHPDHSSGYIDRHSIDLDGQPVAQVSWTEAVEFCNWLSERDSLPAAYLKSGDRYVLQHPVTIGYRLPSEAEWEYAARYAAPGRFWRFPWGDALPMDKQVGNLAGAETSGSLPASLPGYRDDYPVAAPVGRFTPSPLGLQDMAGNVSEWINDYYLSYVDATPAIDPLGPDDGLRHVIRGANWRSAVVTDLRLAWRDGEEGRSPTLGFRVARYAE